MRMWGVVLVLALIGAGAFVAVPRAEERRAAPPAAAPQPVARFSDADYEEHIRELRKKVPHEGFSVVIAKPFVVVGDEDPDKVRSRARGTVAWAVEKLKRDYFREDPAEIIDVWLFADTASYEHHNEMLFGSRPSTPFGFYSPQNRALVMNISTGGGTLVHEIVHPFMASNFPECPAWFNEGLASLYEQSAERNGRIAGLTNWRLAGLQKAIGLGKVPPFETLCGTTTREFYDEDPGTNYAQARYLCYYLQEQGLLVKYYHAFREGAAQDPTGVETLKAVLGEDDLAAFQQRWQEFVLGLRFDG